MFINDPHLSSADLFVDALFPGDALSLLWKTPVIFALTIYHALSTRTNLSHPAVNAAHLFGAFVCICSTIGPQRQRLRDTSVLSHHAVPVPGGLDRRRLVRNEDDLSILRHLAQRFKKPAQVGLVEGRIHFVEQHEGRRPHREQRQQQGRRCKGALTA